GDAVQPGARRGPAVEPVVPAPGPQQCLLHLVLGIVHRAQHPVAVPQQLAPVRVGEPAEVLVTGHEGPPVRCAHSHTGTDPPAGRNSSRYRRFCPDRRISTGSAPRGPRQDTRRYRPVDTGPGRTRQGWVLALTSAAGFMIALDTTVVATVLTTIRRDLHPSAESLEWTVNGYVLTF